jgi:hypothetical protein
MRRIDSLNRESAATGNLTEAVALLAKRIEAIRKALIYGVRPERTFRAAATKFLEENQHKRSVTDALLRSSLERMSANWQVLLFRGLGRP